jgi:hypothetical protein
MESLPRQCTMAAALPPVLLLASIVVSAAALSPELAVRSGAERGGIEVRDCLGQPAAWPGTAMRMPALSNESVSLSLSPPHLASASLACLYVRSLTLSDGAVDHRSSTVSVA